MPCAALRGGAKRARAYARKLECAVVNSVRLVHARRAGAPPPTQLLPLSREDVELFYTAAPLSWTWSFAEPIDADGLFLALESALVQYPLLAGRLVSLAADEFGRRRVAVDCGNQGALLTVITCSGVAPQRPCCATSGGVIAIAPTMSQGPRSLKALKNDAQAPLLDVTVIYYADGCCTLGVKSSHGLTDGASLAGFVAYWARCYSSPEAPPLHAPQLDRSALDELMRGEQEENDEAAPGCCMVLNTPRASLPMTSPSGSLVPAPSFVKLAKIVLRAATDPSLGFTDPTAVRGALFFFSREQLGRLKARGDGAQSANAPRGCSSFDAVTACLWHAVACARKRRGMLDAAARAAPARLFFPLNIRGRVALSDSYVGNAIVVACCTMDDEALRDGSFADIVAAVRSGKAAAQAPASIRAELRFLDAASKLRGSGTLSFAINPFANDLLISDFRFPAAPLLDSSFGSAKPTWFEPAVGDPIRVPYIGFLSLAPPDSQACLMVGVHLPVDELLEVQRKVQQLCAE